MTGLHHGGFIDPVALDDWAKRGGSALNSTTSSSPKRWKGPTGEKPGTCKRCGKNRVDRHHIAPRYIFGLEFNTFGTVHLCRECHQLWHNDLERYIRLRVLRGAIQPEALAFPGLRVSSQRKMDLIRSRAVRRVRHRFALENPPSVPPPPVRTLLWPRYWPSENGVRRALEEQA